MGPIVPVAPKAVRDDGNVPFVSPQPGVTPTAPEHLATKAYVDVLQSYVDGLILGLKWKQSVRVATTANGTLATAFENGDTLDGVTLATNDRVLLKNQTTGSENGIYTVNASGAPTRATDADSGPELVSAAVFVQEGTANADKAFVCTNNSITIGSTSITWSSFASIAGALLAASNLSDLASASTARTNLGLGALAVLSSLDINMLVDSGGSAGDGSILFFRSGIVKASSPAPGANYAPYWDGSTIQWMAVSP